PPLELDTLSLHDALPIYPPADIRLFAAGRGVGRAACGFRLFVLGLWAGRCAARRRLRSLRLGRACRWSHGPETCQGAFRLFAALDRKSTRLNSSHVKISY